MGPVHFMGLESKYFLRVGVGGWGGIPAFFCPRSKLSILLLVEYITDYTLQILVQAYNWA